MLHTLRARSFVLGLLPLLALSAACADAGSGEDTDATEQGKHIKPTDSENLSRIEVDVPSGWTLPVNPADDATAVYRSAVVTLGVPSRLTEGTGCVTITSKFDRQIDTCRVDVTKGQLTRFKLGSIKTTYDASATGPLARDFGPTPKLQVFHTSVPANVATAPTEDLVFTQSGSLNNAFWNGNGPRPVLAPAGDYRFTFGIAVLDDVKKSLAQGESATIALAQVDKRATISIKKPASRDLPDAPLNGCQRANRTFLVQRSVDNGALAYGEPSANVQHMANASPSYVGYVASEPGGLVAWKDVPMTADTDVKVFPFVAGEGAMHYEVVVNNVAMPLTLGPGDKQVIQLERIDIDHVEVTKETGEVYSAQGTWQLFRQGPNSTWIPMTRRAGQYSDCSGNPVEQQATYPTGTGLDVLPGTYRVLISYSTAEGPKQQDQTFNVP